MPSSDAVERALRLERAGRRDAARLLLESALKSEPDNIEAWTLLAHLAYDLQDPSRTIYALEQVVRLEPDNLRAQEHLHYLTGRTSAPPPPDPVSPPPIEAPRTRRGVRWALGAGLAAILLAGIGSQIPALRARIVPVQAEAAPAALYGNSPSASAGSPLLAYIPRQLARLTRSEQTSPTIPTPHPTPAEPPALVDYQPLADALEAHRRYTAVKSGYDLGIGFVDVATGQVINIEGDTRYHAMSSFKGPLSAYYLWLLERGQIAEQPGDRDHLARMLDISANTDTSCIFQRVGGIAPFNDWLADQGLTRENNFVLKWQEWDCADAGSYHPPIDWRYSRGDAVLGLPGGSELLACPIPQLPCDKAFAPVELAEWYARLYRGEVIGPAYRDILFSLMHGYYGQALFMQNQAAAPGVTVYVKGGSFEATDEYRENFVNEAGLVVTPYGTFALTVFMQQNPEWPGTWPISEAARIATEYFEQTHLTTVGSPPPAQGDQ